MVRGLLFNVTSARDKSGVTVDPLKVPVQQSSLLSLVGTVPGEASEHCSKNRFEACASVFAVSHKENRMVRYSAAILLFGIALIGFVDAGGGKKGKLKIGDPAPTFSALPGIDGKDHGLDEYKDKDVVVVVITCNHCPVAVAYEDRIINFTKKYAGDPKSKVAVVAINVNNLDADKLDKMKIRAEEKGFNFPYLHDASQKIGRELGASVTPEFYVFNKERKLVYHGSMDNNQKNPTKNYLEPAVDAALKGETPAVQETKAFGCTVKYEKGTK
jgi:peroxiredoxin